MTYLNVDEVETAIAIAAGPANAAFTELVINLYPTSGTSDDYAYSRGFLDATKGKVLGFTIEWGRQRPTLPKSFHPDYVDMVPIIEEVTSGLLAFCLACSGLKGADADCMWSPRWPKLGGQTSIPTEGTSGSSWPTPSTQHRRSTRPHASTGRPNRGPNRPAHAHWLDGSTADWECGTPSNVNAFIHASYMG